MRQSIFVDTNVVLRMLLNDHPDHSARSRRFFQDALANGIDLWCSSTVIFEAIYYFESTLKRSRSDIAASVGEFVKLPILRVQDDWAILAALEMYSQITKLSFADCFHAALAIESDSKTIATFDKAFGRIQGLTRIEPAELQES